MTRHYRQREIKHPDAEPAGDDHPPAIMVDRLAAARRRGESFEEAWSAALPAALAAQTWPSREDWSAAFGATVTAWADAYHRVDAQEAHLAFARAA